ncbi:hypothetical protein SCUCBS95973_002845 [Sporothrix curviconia]|uniref:Uncharacterized protein n=1 Tax=Sporothrix curviconia TaxID=1260050 RepID=A0ABP0BAH5_9PEZI
MIAKTETEESPALPPPLYPDYLPHYDPDESVEMVGPFEHDEPGLRADKDDGECARDNGRVLLNLC